MAFDIKHLKRTFWFPSLTLLLGGIISVIILCYIPPFNDFIYCLKVQAYLGSTTAMIKLVGTDIRHNYYWLRMAAEHGNIEAIFEVGNLNQPTPEALVWYKKGAALGSVECMVEVGKAYQYGLYGVPVNLSEANKWYDKANSIYLEDKRKRGYW